LHIVAGAKQFDPDRALDRAMEVFRLQGYAGTSMQDLEQATGLGRGSIYNAFGDKHALFIATLEKYIAAHEAQLAAMLLAAPTAIEGIRLVLRSGAVYCGSAKGRSGCLIGNTATECGNRDKAVSAVLEGALERLTELFADSLCRAQEEGDFAADRDPDLAARFLVMSVQGMNLLAKASPQPNVHQGIAEEILRVLD
jgi:TetR/AcrR family transcriptional repressor of nem operon